VLFSKLSGNISRCKTMRGRCVGHTEQMQQLFSDRLMDFDEGRGGLFKTFANSHSTCEFEPIYLQCSDEPLTSTLWAQWLHY